MSSRRTSHSEEASAHAMAGTARARTGSGSSARSGASGHGKPATAPTTLEANVSCHFRYTGCYLLVIISDGCDMLRQEQLCQTLKLNTAASTSPESEAPADLASQLEQLDVEWNRKFIEHTTQQIAKGLLSWDSQQTKCDLKPLEAFLESSLIRMNQSAASGEQSANPEIVLQYAEDSLAVEVLLNPSLFTLTQCLRNVLCSPTGAVHVIYAGASFEETGSWILQDGSFSAYNFYELVQNEEGTSFVPPPASPLASAQTDTCKGHSSIAEHLSCHDIVLHFHTQRPGEWSVLTNIFANHQFEPISNSMTSSLIMAELSGKSRRDSPSKRRRHLFHFDLNPADSPDGVQGSAALIDFLGEKLTKYYAARTTVSQARFGTSADSSLADSVGYIRLDRPTMYVFPGGQGDCALFGLDNGFTMLIDGGFLPGHKSFWNFVRHLQRLDSVVVTHLGEDNLFGLNTLLENKLMREKWESFKAPQIGYLFCNDQFAQQQPSSNGQTLKALQDVATLSLTGLNGQFFNSLNLLQIEPLACIRNIDSINCTCPGPSSLRPKAADKPVPVTLYHKVGHGTLYMYVLNPTLEGITKPQPATNATDEPSATIPEADQQSICSLLVWRPHDLQEKITRILIPGNCTQADILEGFETLLAMSKVNTRVSRYAPKPKSDGETTVEMVELDILLGHPYPCTGDNIEAMLKSREAEKAVKFRQTPGSLHGYRRSASVAPKVISRQQQQQQKSTQSRQRSTTPSRFSRFRSVSPAPRRDGRKAVKEVTTPTGGAAPPLPGRHLVKAVPATRSRAPDETSLTSQQSRQLKTISRPPSSASSGDRAHRVPPVSKSSASRPPAAGSTAPKPPPPKASARSSSVSKSRPLPPITKTETANTATTVKASPILAQQSTGKVFKSPREFRKSAETSKAAPSAASKEADSKKADPSQPRPVPRKVKKPEVTVLTKDDAAPEPPKDEESASADALKTAAPAIVAAAAVATVVAGSATEPGTDNEEAARELPNGSIPRNETYEKELDKLAVDKDLIDVKGGYDDGEDLSIRSTTDEEVLKITQRIAEREKAAAAGQAMADISKSPSPVVDSQATGVEVDEDEPSNRTVTPDIEDSTDLPVEADVTADTDTNLSAAESSVVTTASKTETAEIVEVKVDDSEADHGQLDSLASADLDAELGTVAPPPPTPARPDSEIAEIDASSNLPQELEEQQQPSQADEKEVATKEAIMAEQAPSQEPQLESDASAVASSPTVSEVSPVLATGKLEEQSMPVPIGMTSSISENTGLDVPKDLDVQLSTSISDVDLMQRSMSDMDTASSKATIEETVTTSEVTESGAEETDEPAKAESAAGESSTSLPSDDKQTSESTVAAVDIAKAPHSQPNESETFTEQPQSSPLESELKTDVISLEESSVPKAAAEQKENAIPAASAITHEEEAIKETEASQASKENVPEKEADLSKVEKSSVESTITATDAEIKVETEQVDDAKSKVVAETADAVSAGSKDESDKETTEEKAVPAVEGIPAQTEADAELAAAEPTTPVLKAEKTEESAAEAEAERQPVEAVALPISPTDKSATAATAVEPAEADIAADNLADQTTADSGTLEQAGSGETDKTPEQSAQKSLDSTVSEIESQPEPKVETTSQVAIAQPATFEANADSIDKLETDNAGDEVVHPKEVKEAVATAEHEDRSVEATIEKTKVPTSESAPQEMASAEAESDKRTIEEEAEPAAESVSVRTEADAAPAADEPTTPVLREEKAAESAAEIKAHPVETVAPEEERGDAASASGTEIGEQSTAVEPIETSAPESEQVPAEPVESESKLEKGVAVESNETLAQTTIFDQPSSISESKSNIQPVDIIDETCKLSTTHTSITEEKSVQESQPTVPSEVVAPEEAQSSVVELPENQQVTGQGENAQTIEPTRGASADVLSETDEDSSQREQVKEAASEAKEQSTFKSESIATEKEINTEQANSLEAGKEKSVDDAHLPAETSPAETAVKNEPQTVPLTLQQELEAELKSEKAKSETESAPTSLTLEQELVAAAAKETESAEKIVDKTEMAEPVATEQKPTAAAAAEQESTAADEAVPVKESISVAVEETEIKEKAHEATLDDVADDKTADIADAFIADTAQEAAKEPDVGKATQAESVTLESSGEGETVPIEKTADIEGSDYFDKIASEKQVPLTETVKHEDNEPPQQIDAPEKDAVTRELEKIEPLAESEKDYLDKVAEEKENITVELKEEVEEIVHSSAETGAKEDTLSADASNEITVTDEVTKAEKTLTVLPAEPLETSLKTAELPSGHVETATEPKEDKVVPDESAGQTKDSADYFDKLAKEKEIALKETVELKEESVAVETKPEVSDERAEKLAKIPTTPTIAAPDYFDRLVEEKQVPITATYEVTEGEAVESDASKAEVSSEAAGEMEATSGESKSIEATAEKAESDTSASVLDKADEKSTVDEPTAPAVESETEAASTGKSIDEPVSLESQQSAPEVKSTEKIEEKITLTLEPSDAASGLDQAEEDKENLTVQAVESHKVEATTSNETSLEPEQVPFDLAGSVADSRPDIKMESQVEEAITASSAGQSVYSDESPAPAAMPATEPADSSDNQETVIKALDSKEVADEPLSQATESSNAQEVIQPEATLEQTESDSIKPDELGRTADKVEAVAADKPTEASLPASERQLSEKADVKEISQSAISESTPASIPETKPDSSDKLEIDTADPTPSDGKVHDDKQALTSKQSEGKMDDIDSKVESESTAVTDADVDNNEHRTASGQAEQAESTAASEEAKPETSISSESPKDAATTQIADTSELDKTQVTFSESSAGEIQQKIDSSSEVSHSDVGPEAEVKGNLTEEIVEQPDSPKEQHSPSSDSSDALNRKTQSPFEIIDDDEEGKPSDDKGESAPGESPVVESPATESIDDLPTATAHGPEITEMSTPADSPKEVQANITAGTEATIESEFVTVDKDQLGESMKAAKSKTQQYRRTDSEFDKAFMASSDITGDEAVDLQPTDAAEPSGDDIETSKLETYFTSDLMKPIESQPKEAEEEAASNGFELVDKDDIAGEEQVDENKNLLQEPKAEGKVALKEAILEESPVLATNLEAASLEPIVAEVKQLQVETVLEAKPTVEDVLPAEDTQTKEALATTIKPDEAKADRVEPLQSETHEKETAESVPAAQMALTEAKECSTEALATNGDTAAALSDPTAQTASLDGSSESALESITSTASTESAATVTEVKKPAAEVAAVSTDSLERSVGENAEESAKETPIGEHIQEPATEHSALSEETLSSAEATSTSTPKQLDGIELSFTNLAESADAPETTTKVNGHGTTEAKTAQEIESLEGEAEMGAVHGVPLSRQVTAVADDLASHEADSKDLSAATLAASSSALAVESEAVIGSSDDSLTTQTQLPNEQSASGKVETESTMSQVDQLADKSIADAPSVVDEPAAPSFTSTEIEESATSTEIGAPPVSPTTKADTDKKEEASASLQQETDQVQQQQSIADEPAESLKAMPSEAVSSVGEGQTATKLESEIEPMASGEVLVAQTVTSDMPSTAQETKPDSGDNKQADSKDVSDSDHSAPTSLKVDVEAEVEQQLASDLLAQADEMPNAKAAASSSLPPDLPPETDGKTVSEESNAQVQPATQEHLDLSDQWKPVAPSEQFETARKSLESAESLGFAAPAVDLSKADDQADLNQSSEPEHKVVKKQLRDEEFFEDNASVTHDDSSVEATPSKMVENETASKTTDEPISLDSQKSLESTPPAKFETDSKDGQPMLPIKAEVEHKIPSSDEAPPASSGPSEEQALEATKPVSIQSEILAAEAEAVIQKEQTLVEKEEPGLLAGQPLTSDAKFTKETAIAETETTETSQPAIEATKGDQLPLDSLEPSFDSTKQSKTDDKETENEAAKVITNGVHSADSSAQHSAQSSGPASIDNAVNKLDVVAQAESSQVVAETVELQRSVSQESTQQSEIIKSEQGTLDDSQSKQTVEERHEPQSDWQHGTAESNKSDENAAKQLNTADTSKQNLTQSDAPSTGTLPALNEKSEEMFKIASLEEAQKAEKSTPPMSPVSKTDARSVLSDAEDKSLGNLSEKSAASTKLEPVISESESTANGVELAVPVSSSVSKAELTLEAPVELTESTTLDQVASEKVESSQLSPLKSEPSTFFEKEETVTLIEKQITETALPMSPGAQSTSSETNKEVESELAPSQVDLNKLLGNCDATSAGEEASQTVAVAVDSQMDSAEKVLLSSADGAVDAAPSESSQAKASGADADAVMEKTTALESAEDEPKARETLGESVAAERLHSLESDKSVISSSSDVNEDDSAQKAEPLEKGEFKSIPENVIDSKLETATSKASIVKEAPESADTDTKEWLATTERQVDIEEQSKSEIDSIPTIEQSEKNALEPVASSTAIDESISASYPKPTDSTPPASPSTTDPKRASSMLEFATSMIADADVPTEQPVEAAAVPELMQSSLPEPYQIATAVIDLVNDKVKELQSSDQLTKTAPAADQPELAVEIEEAKQAELDIIDQIKSESIDLENLRKSEDKVVESAELASELPAAKLTHAPDSKTTTEQVDSAEPAIEATEMTFTETKVVDIAERRMSDDFVPYVPSEEPSKAVDPKVDLGIEDFDHENYNNRFDTVVTVAKIDAIDVEKNALAHETAVSSSADKYRVEDDDDDMGSFEASVSPVVTSVEVSAPFEFTPLSAEMVHLPESDASLEVSLKEGDAPVFSSTLVSSVTEPSAKDNLGVTLGAEPVNPSDISLVDSGSLAQAELDSAAETKLEEGIAVKEESGIEILSFTSSKSSTLEPGTDSIAVGTLAASSEEVVLEQIDRFHGESKAFPEQNMTEARTVMERDLVESKQTVERTEAQTVELAEPVKSPPADCTVIETSPEMKSSTITITTFASSPPAVGTLTDAEPNSLPTSTALTESISTSSSSYYVEPAMSSSILRSSDAAYISGTMEESEPSSTSTSIDSSDEDHNNMFQFNPNSGSITTTPTSPVPTGSLVTATGTAPTMTTTMSFVLSGSASNGSAGNNAVASGRGNGTGASIPFDVDREWGQPLGLPPPQPPSSSNSAKLPPLPPQSRVRNLSQDRSSQARKPPVHTSENGQSSGVQSRIHPVYVELAYVPGHGKRGYCDEQFFRKIRARYYVFSGVTPSRQVFDALLSAKATWDRKDLYTTIIPTYESEALLAWIADNQERLTELRIDVTPAANRCSINLADDGTGQQDTNAPEHAEDSCAAYKVEL